MGGAAAPHDFVKVSVIVQRFFMLPLLICYLLIYSAAPDENGPPLVYVVLALGGLSFF